MHNAAFAALGLDWAYVPLPVTPSRMGEAVRGLAALGFVGANVTIPHKVAVIPFCGEIDATAERAGSVNTLVLQDDVVLGSSTDGLGVSTTIAAAGAHVLILGAGGAARPVTQADDSSTRQYEGIGLGLTISAKLCVLLRGGITVTSVPGEGATFTVTLPMTP